MRSLANDQDVTNGTVVVKFYATWCGPCKIYAPTFERVASQNPDANFYEVDVDQASDIRDSYHVRSVPTTLVLSNGQEVARATGAQSTSVLDLLVKDVLSLPNAKST